MPSTNDEVDDQDRVVDEAELDEHARSSAAREFTTLCCAQRLDSPREENTKRCRLVLLTSSSAAWPLLGCATRPAGRDGRGHVSRARSVLARRGRVRRRVCELSRPARRRARRRAARSWGPGALPEYPRNSYDRGRPDDHRPSADPDPRADTAGGSGVARPVPNAQDLHRFMTLHLPKSRADQLKDADYWAVTGYLLAAQGVSCRPAASVPRTRPRSRFPSADPAPVRASASAFPTLTRGASCRANAAKHRARTVIF